MARARLVASLVAVAAMEVLATALAVVAVVVVETRTHTSEAAGGAGEPGICFIQLGAGTKLLSFDEPNEDLKFFSPGDVVETDAQDP